jgi:4-hydroxy-tetrahydrodipicolinate synthase
VRSDASRDEGQGGAGEAHRVGPAAGLGGGVGQRVTPFAAGGTRLDERALGDLVAWQVAQGSEGLVVG